MTLSFDTVQSVVDSLMADVDDEPSPPVHKLIADAIPVPPGRQHDIHVWLEQLTAGWLRNLADELRSGPFTLEDTMTANLVTLFILGVRFGRKLERADPMPGVGQ